jgi:PhzF family phenazine biosynthesis protein
MSPEPEILRLAAFTDVPEGGNPAGVVLDAATLDDQAMQAIAADVGYSETAFLTGGGDGAYDVRYFSPVAEVPFCGHATIATAVALAHRDGAGDVLLRTPAGPVAVRTATDGAGALTATLTSVEPEVLAIDDGDVDLALAALRWTRDDLDPALPPRIAYAGARHLVLAAATRERLARLDYDFDALDTYMSDRDLTTVDLVWREDPTTFHARNPFPVGGVVEDPATGAAAAAFGAYLRALGEVTPPARVTVLQGEDIGRPSRLLIDLDPGLAAVRVTGGAVRIPAPRPGTAPVEFPPAAPRAARLAATADRGGAGVRQEQLRAIQTPLKERYREEPGSALVTLTADATLGEGLTCKVQTGRALEVAGLHPATGGDGTQLCSGDMLLEALAACAGVTMRAVATSMGIAVEGRVTAEGVLDFRGTLGVDRDAPVGFASIGLRFALEADADDGQIDKLIELTERYCVVLQTLAGTPTLSVGWTRSAGAPAA